MNDARPHLVPVRSREAKDFVRAWHRHHPPPAGQIFAVGAADETGTLRAMAIVDRPVTRHLVDVAKQFHDAREQARQIAQALDWVAPTFSNRPNADTAPGAYRDHGRSTAAPAPPTPPAGRRR
ncbi:XF1762 family protein [Streptomyces longwoodensis]|uniref:XF1762 family protein n=1 Tax=Streptomyces TaxID=1883 RepID=UPI0036BD14F3